MWLAMHIVWAELPEFKGCALVACGGSASAATCIADPPPTHM